MKEGDGMNETVKEFLTAAVWVCSCVTSISAAVVLIVKPVREKVLGLKKEDDGVKCLLRSDMLRTYYRHRENKQIRQFEYENFILMYKAYKAMKGNSFIDHIKSEVDEWEVIS
jgi:hypothetical protein